jgi:cobalamin biosynthesis protein CobD/CbiB
LKDTLEHIRFNPDKGVATAFRAYILADRLLVPGLKAALIDCYFVKEIFDLKEWYPNCRRIIHAFKHLSEDDPLIRLYVDLWVSRNVFQKLDTYDQVIKARLPYAFLVRLLRRADEVGQNPQSMLPLKRKDYTEIAPIP